MQDHPQPNAPVRPDPAPTPNALAARKSRQKKRAAEYAYASKTEPTKPEGRRILEARGIRHAHVLDTVYDLLLTAAEENELVPNRFLFQHGVVATLSSINQQSAQPINIAADAVAGELINRAELYALYDASVGWRDQTTFEDFLETRQKCKRDCFYLGKEILGKDFSDCHRVWTDFFPRFDPATLQPNYTQKQMITWLDSQSEKKDFLLMASRNSFKSSWSHIWLLTLILCLPDVRVLLVSETRPLSKDFIGAIRSYFEVVKGQETRFQCLFPEYTIPMGDGSVLALDCPMARLRLPQSIESTSMDSAVAGRRADIILFDDPISSTSCGNETQRLASISKYDALKKLREVGGLSAVLGTPWHEADLYAELIHRNEEDDNKPLAYRIDPAWQLRPEYQFGDDGRPRRLRDITEQMVTLLFPERLSWKFLQSELRSNESFFASQNLCIFPKDADADLRCTFDEEVLRQHVRPPGFFSSSQTIRVVLSVDTAFSISKLADFSCLVTTKIMRHEDRNIAVVADVDMERWTYSELAKHIVEAIARHRPNDVVIEKNGPWTTLAQEIIKAAMLRNIILPTIFWRDVNLGGNTPRSKASRIKALEPMLANDELFFTAATWNDICLAQLRNFDGVTKSNSSRKDDFPDSLALGLQTYFPRQVGEQPAENSDLQMAAEKAAQEESLRRQVYQAYFGQSAPVFIPEPDVEEERNPFFRGPAGQSIKRK